MEGNESCSWAVVRAINDNSKTMLPISRRGEKFRAQAGRRQRRIQPCLVPHPSRLCCGRGEWLGVLFVALLLGIVQIAAAPVEWSPIRQCSKRHTVVGQSVDIIGLAYLVSRCLPFFTFCLAWQWAMPAPCFCLFELPERHRGWAVGQRGELMPQCNPKMSMISLLASFGIGTA